MPRLIDADEIRKKAVPHTRGDFGGYNSNIRKWAVLVGDIDDAPTVDAVEVVRCKDCKHGIWDDEEAMWKCVYDAEFDEQYGEYFGFVEYNDGEHFCSYGERKDNG